MTAEWIRFWIVAAVLVLALAGFTCAVIGANRFGFIMNRIHAAGIGDTLGLFCIIAALVIADGFSWNSFKLILILVFMWFTSPVSTHFLGQLEYYTNTELKKYVKKKEYVEKENVEKENGGKGEQ